MNATETQSGSSLDPLVRRLDHCGLLCLFITAKTVPLASYDADWSTQPSFAAALIIASDSVTRVGMTLYSHRAPSECGVAHPDTMAALQTAIISFVFMFSVWA
jgi:hypothetical protein